MARRPARPGGRPRAASWSRPGTTACWPRVYQAFGARVADVFGAFHSADFADQVPLPARRHAAPQRGRDLPVDLGVRAAAARAERARQAGRVRRHRPGLPERRPRLSVAARSRRDLRPGWTGWTTPTGSSPRWPRSGPSPRWPPRRSKPRWPPSPPTPPSRIEPADPTDRIDPTEPTDRIDPFEPMLRIESCDPTDHFEPRLSAMPGILASAGESPRPRPASAPPGRPSRPGPRAARAPSSISRV